MRWAILLCWLAGAALAVEPSEMLEDPALEARARGLDAEIRCLVCRSESIAGSNADFAKDLRLVVRERVEAGDSDDDVRAYLVERFGQYILLRPRFAGPEVMLWLAGPALLLIGGGLAYAFIRRRGKGESSLSADEEARLKAVLEED